MIVPMKRLTLIGLANEREQVLCALQRLKAVQIISEGQLTDSAKLRLLEEKVDRLDSARKSIKAYYKKPLLSPTPQCTEDQLYKSKASGDALCREIEGLESEQSACKAEIEREKALIASLEPFRELGTDIELIKPTKHISYILGVADAKAMEVIESIESCLDTHIGLETFGAEGARAVIIACQSIDYEPVMRMLKETGFVEFMPPKLTGTFSQNIEKEKAKLTSISERLEEINKQLAEAAKKRAELDMAADAYVIERDRAQGDAALSVSEYAYVLDGWARADRLDDIKAAIESVTDAYYMDTRDPLDDETPPSVTRNSRLIEPFEVITEMYALPSYRGMDAAAVMAPFYFLFFGMMLSDFGYGMLLFIGGMLYTKYLKPMGNTAKLVKVITYGGLSTMLCAPFIGTFFGMEWNDIFSTTIFPLLFDPMTDVMPMMLLSCGLGLVHMYAGIIAKMYMCFRDGDWQSAIFDQLSWMLLLTGLVLLFAAPAIKTAALVLIILGGGMLLLFSGRSAKNPIIRLGKGFSALYNITGYLSDILSYVRIFALGLVSGAMGMVFNLIGGLLYKAFGGLGVPGVIIGLIIAGFLLIVLHLFSLFINTLGAFAHTARLQFIEFFGKFYEADGVRFKPLGMNTRTVNIVDDAAE